ncbi:MAG: hypothetical protein K0S65_5028 [Labilithrix sp.]|nr:hypothetical protein [Labilithrix sp.]
MTRRVATLLTVLLLACGGALGSAKSDVKSGRVPEAKEKLVALEPEARSWNGARRAEYVLYRGLVHHSLGDREAATFWLREAQSIEARSPKTFSDDDRTRLDLALDSLGVGAAPASRP